MEIWAPDNPTPQRNHERNKSPLRVGTKLKTITPSGAHVGHSSWSAAVFSLLLMHRNNGHFDF